MRTYLLTVLLILTSTPATAADATLNPAARTLLERADALHDRGDDAAALETYVDAVKADPAAASFETIRKYAPIEYSVGSAPPSSTPSPRTSKAEIAALRQYVDLRPSDAEATKALLALVDLPEAESLLAPMFKSRPSDPELYATRANVYARHHRVEASIADATKAAELDTLNPERYYFLGVLIYEAASRDASLAPSQKRALITKGLAALQRAETLRPDYVEAMTFRSLMLRQRALLETDPALKKKSIAEADAIRERAIKSIRRRRKAAAHG